MSERVCTKCGQSKALDQFSGSKNRKRKSSWCKACAAEHVREVRKNWSPERYQHEKNRKASAKARAHAVAHIRERRKIDPHLRDTEYEARFQKRHPGMNRLEWECAKAQKHNELIAKRTTEKQAKIKARLLRREQRAKEIAEKVARGEMYPSGKVKGRIRTIQFLEKYHNDSAYYALVCCRRRLANLVRGEGTKKGKIVELIGCSGKELVEWIESQFKPGMSWENKGEWHIDHIKPCASFDLTNIEQQKACFHYTNLRPLWKHENWSRPKMRRLSA